MASSLGPFPLLLLFLVLNTSSSSSSETSGCLMDDCPIYPQFVPLANASQIPRLLQAFQEIDEFLQMQIQEYQLPSFVASIVYDQDIVWSKGYGKRNPFCPSSSSSSPSSSSSNQQCEGTWNEPPTIDSTVKVASITKTFTTLMMAVLKDAGMISFEDAVSKYLPSFSIRNPFFNSSRPIDLKMLASHLSGLPREIPCYNGKVSSCTQDEILSRIPELYLVLPPYTRPHYSNLGIALLGHALEAAVGVPYESFVEQKLLPSIGMLSSGFNYTPEIISRRAVGVVPLVQPVNGRTAVPAPFTDDGWGNPMAGLYSTARDISTYISFLFRDQESGWDSSVLLDGISVRELLLPSSVLRDGNAGFGYPWEFNYTLRSWPNISSSSPFTGGYWVKSKAGDAPGYHSQIAMQQDLKLGLFFVTMEEEVPEPTNSLFTIPALDILIPAFLEVLWPLQPTYIPPANTQVFEGLYLCNANANVENPEGPGWEIFEMDGVLYGSSYLFNSTNSSSTSTLMETMEKEVIELSQDEYYELYDVLMSTAGSSSSRLFSSAPQAIGASVKSAMVNLTQTDFDPFVLQMQLLAPDQCRWLDDGMNLEYLYCSPDPSLTFCEFIHLMQHNCTFVSK